MSKFLDELFENLDQPENEHDDEITESVEDTIQDDEVEEIEHDGEAEEVAEVKEPEEASEETQADDDDDTELTPAERKAYGRLKALQDEREKRKSAVEEAKARTAERDQALADLAEMRRMQAELDAQNLPDAYEDPTGYVAAKEAQFHEKMVVQALNFGIERATAKHGVEEVEKAVAWFDSQASANPGIPLRENMMKQPDQVEYAVNSYKQAQQMNAFAGGDVSALVAELQRAGYNISKSETPTVAAPAAPVPQLATAPANAPATNAPAAPKRSKLASAQGSTTAAPKQMSMLDAVVRRK